MARPRILTTLAMHPAGDRLLEAVADIVIAPDPGAATLQRLLGDADVLVVRTHLPADLLDTKHRLIGIVRHGTGLDMIPMEAATRQAIPVANVPGVNAQAVAEYCIGSLLALSRQLLAMDRELRSTEWNESRKYTERTLELAGRTIGIVGLGAIGRRLAEICHHGFHMRVVGIPRRGVLPAFIEAVELDTLFRDSDMVSLNCPLTPETRHLVNERRLRSMQPHALLVNVARGAVIDEEALLKALREGWIAGAALDVYAEQPLRRDHPFLGLANVLLTPHAAGLTQEASRRMSVGTAHAVLRLLAGERPEHLVNPEIWEQAVLRRAQLADDATTNALQ